VGLVPEAQLQDAIIVYSGVGIVQYISGSRAGNTVTIQARITPRYVRSGSQVRTYLNCLGQEAIFDHWSSVVPASSMRIYSHNQEITSQAQYFVYSPAGWIQPIANTTTGLRYGRTDYLSTTFNNDGSLAIPANMGCEIIMIGQYTDLTAEFTFSVESKIAVQFLSAEHFSFHSYIGPGNAGYLESLRSQMQVRFGNVIRHDKFPIQIPATADFLLVKYPPTPADAYAWADPDLNVPQLSGGSYRLAAAANVLSTDYTHSGALPIQGQWRDSDQSGDSVFLPMLSDPVLLASPEYFVPSGVAYDPCMTYGACPGSLLDEIFQATMPIDVFYYSVERTGSGLTRIPLKQVGPKWSPQAAQVSGFDGGDGVTLVPQSPLAGTVVFLPFVSAQVALPPDDPTGCPCGWFDDLGRLQDFIPGQ
jgi:hypothetical protein